MNTARESGGWQTMLNLKIGGALLIAGAALFLLSDTLLGTSQEAAYAMFLGFILVPVGLILVLVGIFQVLIGKLRNRPE